MPLSLLAALVASALYAGFQWTVQLVVYPQMTPVSARTTEDFPVYEAAHQRRITTLVGPLFVALAAGCGWLLLDRGPVPWAVAGVAAALAVVVVAVTALLAVPAHRTLSRAWDAAAHRRLLRADRVRVAAASAQVLLLVAAAATV